MRKSSSYIKFSVGLKLSRPPNGKWRSCMLLLSFDSSSFLFGSHIRTILSVLFRSTYKVESEGKGQGVERQRAVCVEDVCMWETMPLHHL